MTVPMSVQKVIDAAAAHGQTITVIEYPDGTRTALDAAAAVGCELDQIVKSMVFQADEELVLALTAGSHLVDAEVLASLAGVGRCGRADADVVRDITGFAIGGVPPFGHRTALRTWLDPTLLDYPEVWAAAGTPRHVFGIDPKDLLRFTNATAAAFTR